MRICVLRDLAMAAIAMSVVATDVRGQGPVPQVRTQAPGYYRMMLGEFEITIVSDGTAPKDYDQLMTNTTPAEVRALFARNFETLPVEASINTFLINTGSKLILVDTGAGDFFGRKSGGQLFANLKASGYRPEQIDAVLITHVHGDHSGGLALNGVISFPRADVYVNELERDYWLNAANAAKAPDEATRGFARAHEALDPYLKAGKLKTFKGETEMFPGVRAIPSPGHTPGHSLYVLESKGKKLVLIGDTVHAVEVQFPKPSVTIQYDIDSKRAATQRKRILADAAEHGYLVGGDHISFPGLGHVRAEGEGYTWVPVSYRLVD